MNDPQVEVRIVASPSQYRSANSVIIFVNTNFFEVLENPITGHQTFTVRSTPVSEPLLINFNPRSFNQGHILQILRDELVNHPWLCEGLASDISTTATESDFEPDGLKLTVYVKITYQTVVVLSDSPPPSPNHEALTLRALLLRMVLLGRVGLEAAKLETESCSICLDDFSGSSSKLRGFPTRMSCSHVFHHRCLLEWLHRKNTCPLCRTELYNR